MRGLAQMYKNMIYLDSMCVLLCFINLLGLSRNVIKPINDMLNSMQSGSGLFLLIFIVWASYIAGLACCNVSIYGNIDRKYKDFFTAIIHTFYN